MVHVNVIPNKVTSIILERDSAKLKKMGKTQYYPSNKIESKATLRWRCKIDTIPRKREFFFERLVFLLPPPDAILPEDAENQNQDSKKPPKSNKYPTISL